MCGKRFIWTSSNFDCECDKLCDVGEYLDYKNCKCRKRLIYKLIEECSENISGNKMLHNETLNVISLDVYQKVCNSCTIYIVLCAVFFIASRCISSVFIYFHWCLKDLRKVFVLSLMLVLKQQVIKHINGKYRTN